MREGMMLLEAMITVIIAGIIAAIFSSISYYTFIQANLLKRQNTQTILEVIRSRLVNLSDNPDSDPYFELPKEGSDNTVSINVGMSHDAWGRAIRYYPIDLGAANTVDENLANNTASISPNPNVLGRLLSAGEDGVISTMAGHASVQGDDLMLEIGVGETNHYKLYGGSEILSETRGYNSAIVSDTAPASPIEGTLWYDTVSGAMKIYQNGSWTIL